MTPCWMISLLTPASVALLEKQPLPCRPWGFSPADTTASVATGRAGQSADSPHGYHITVSSCWLLLPAPSEGHRLLVAPSPWASFTPTPPFSFLMRPPSAPVGRRATDTVCRRHGDLSFSAACVFQFSCYSLSWLPGSLSSSDFSSLSETALILLCWFK